jgi:hypothetical protein
MRRALLVLLPAACLAFTALVLAPPESAADGKARPRLMNDETRAAIQRGLRYLVRTQVSDGSDADGAWRCDAGNKVNEMYVVFEGGRNVPHVGVTALGVLAFLAAGHEPGRGPYGQVVERAVQFLVRHVQNDGYVQAHETRMYSHAFATLALAEVYGMSRHPDLREKLQSAVEFTVRCQNETGGWRYKPFTVDSDMSVTVCQVVALRAARNVGIKVPQSTIDRALGYVISSAITEDRPYGADRGTFYYQPASTRYNRSSFSLTAAGLTTLFQAGLYDNRMMRAYIEARGIDKDPPPSVEDSVGVMRQYYEDVRLRHAEHYFFYYGNYYAAQALYHIGAYSPEVWESWYDMVRKDLLRLERRTTADGGPEESFWVSNVGSTHTYATASAILILSIPFDYLPIHQR